MKKTVIVNGTPCKVEFEYRNTGELVEQHTRIKPNKTPGSFRIEIYYHKAVVTINGVEYPCMQRTYSNGLYRTKEFFYNGHFHASQKKMVERILELSNSGEGDLSA